MEAQKTKRKRHQIYRPVAHAHSLIDVCRDFATEEQCIEYMEKMRWPEGVECVACGSKRVSKYTTNETERNRKNPKTGEVEVKRVPGRTIYQCLECKHQFTATVGTLFNDSHLPLSQWFKAVALMCEAKKGISARQVQSHLQIGSYRTAWYLNHRIRKAMEGVEAKPLSGVVEVDETYIGGRYDKRRKRAKYDKEPVFGMVERGGEARTWHVPQMNRFNVIGKIADGISASADLVCTDESSLYHRMPENVERHEIVNHSAKEYVRGQVHTGTVDGYWSLLKRGLIGSFHHVSIKHLFRYLAEFELRWNNRDNADLFAVVIIRLLIASALQYKALIAPVSEHTDNGPEATWDGEPL
jgi:DNA-directed RNA polymerase subunit RPC12/RpoP